MFGFSVKSVAAVLTAVVIASGASSLEAQSAHRKRRESNANRKARIERTIQDTYTHQVGGRWRRRLSALPLRRRPAAQQRGHLVGLRNLLPEPEARHPG